MHEQLHDLGHKEWITLGRQKNAFYEFLKRFDSRRIGHELVDIVKRQTLQQKLPEMLLSSQFAKGV